MKALIVEDDFTSRLFLQTFLSRYGECHVAVNGKEAVEAFRLATNNGSPYDLICMDIMMPEMDGQEAVRQMRALEDAGGVLSHRGVKIIMTTAVTDIQRSDAIIPENFVTLICSNRLIPANCWANSSLSSLCNEFAAERVCPIPRFVSVSPRWIIGRAGWRRLPAARIVTSDNQ